MTYLMIVRAPEGPRDATATPEDASAGPTPEDGGPQEWFEDVTRRGVHLAGDRLRPPSDASCVRVRDGETLVTHGPFVEVVEQIAGFDLLQVTDLEEAVGVAAAHPVARSGALELRELVPHQDDPDGGGNAVLDGPVTYLLLMGSEPGAPGEAPETTGAPVRWIEEMGRRGVDRGGSPLASPAHAVTVRVRGGEVALTHGPFAELAEQVEGYNLIDASDVDEALEIAAAHPAARVGVIEVRPVWPF